MNALLSLRKVRRQEGEKHSDAEKQLFKAGMALIRNLS